MRQQTPGVANDQIERQDRRFALAKLLFTMNSIHGLAEVKSEKRAGGSKEDLGPRT